jgi:putative ABC transport system permease protein
MTLIRLALANLRLEPLTAAVNVALFALGAASIVLLVLVGQQIGATLSRDARGIDLVLGAKGSPLQLVLSSVYHADIPTGNIPLAEAQHWAEDPRVAMAIPLSLGDSYRGFRIVGTTPDYPGHYGAQLAKGRFWAESLEAVVGSAVADAGGLEVGSTFVGAHGLSGSGHQHAERPYRVVGVLQATGGVMDRLVLTPLQSVWAIHEHHDNGDEDHDEKEDAHEDGHHEELHSEESGDERREITAMLLVYATPLAATSLPRQINLESKLQAAAPAFELVRLLKLIGLGLDGLRVFAAVLVLTAGFSVFAALYGALKARRYDIAMMRCLGATRSEVFMTLLLEGLLLSLAGTLVGFILGHGVTELLGQWLASTRGVRLSGAAWLWQEWLLLAFLLGIGLLAAALPSWQAYRTDVAATLSRG